MSMLSKDQIKQMIKHYDVKTTDDIKDTFKDMFGEAIQEIMEAELAMIKIQKRRKIQITDAMARAVRPYGHRNLVIFH